MGKSHRLWRALESVHGLRAVAAEWRAHLGEEYKAASKFLAPDGSRASAYPCPAHSPCDCSHDVVEHGPEDLVAVCCCEPRRCDPLPLTRADIVVYEVDRRALGEALAVALGAVAQHASMGGLPLTWSIGTYSPRPGHLFPVHMTVQTEPEDLRHVVDALVARAGGPFILAAPTRDLFRAEYEDVLRRRRAHFISLADDFALDMVGSIRPRRTVSEILAPFLHAVLPASRGSDVRLERAATTNARVFQRQGRTWLVAYGSESRTIQHLKGMDYICHLLRNPDDEVHAITLRSAAAGRQGTPAAGSAGEILDSEALGNLRRRIAEIDQDLAEAEANHDLGRPPALQEEREALLAEVRRATGLGGRQRQAASDRERARQSVTQAIRRALEAIKKDHAALWRHLRKSLKTGEVFAYRPDDETPWST